jgi:hypothetical protein
MAVKERPRSVTILAILLLIQAVALPDIGSFRVNPIWHIQGDSLSIDWTDAPVTALISIPLAILALVAAFGLLRLWRSAWLNAMLVQGMVLLFLLLAHFQGKISDMADYGLLAFAIFIVVYLNYSEVKATFTPLPEPNEGEPYA